MSFQLGLSQNLSQSLQLSPQLQQAIKLLQLGRFDLIEQIQKELLENPVLELKEKPNLIEESAKLREYFGENTTSESLSKYSGDADANQQFIENTAVAKPCLISHLLWQLHEKDISQSELGIAAEIIGDLNKDGYLTSSLEEIASRAGCEIDEVEKVLVEVQLLDPVGIAARDLQECLLIQLECDNRSDKLAAKIIENFLPELEERKYEKILERLEISRDQLAEALNEIKHLDPKPGRRFSEDETIYVTPDVYISKIDNRWQVSVNNSDIPDLELNKNYEKMYQTLDAQSKEAKKYLNQHIKGALWLIKSIEQRAHTIQKVTESILRYQREFFEGGSVSDLKPLILKQVADDIGLHESTVSRATNQKYVNTPHGTFELKFFFSSGYSKSDGASVSAEGVKDQIKNLIDSENPKKPLSDQEIVMALDKSGVRLARRTVAKYRESLGLASSSKRKRVL